MVGFENFSSTSNELKNKENTPSEDKGVKDMPKSSITNEALSMKEEWGSRIDGILYKELTVENIETFANDALDDLTLLNSEILRTSTGNSTDNISSETEDKIYNALGLSSISDILEKISNVRQKIIKLRDYVEYFTKEVDKVIVPPKEDERLIHTGSGRGFEKKDLTPRLLTLMYILNTDFDLEKKDILITKGKVNTEQVRETPYIRVEIPEIERVVYICDEEGNASYIFNTEILKRNKLSINNIDIHNKEEMKRLMETYPGVGKRIIQTKNWRTNISEVLSENIFTNNETKKEQGKKSEFVDREKIELLSFEDFQQEVRNIFPEGETGIQRWYRKERKNHSNWPASPDYAYSKSEWINWLELVGRGKIELLSFEDFQQEVRGIFPEGETGIQRWYNKERKNHSNWPAHPNRYHAKKGWIGFAELVDKKL